MKENKRLVPIASTIPITNGMVWALVLFHLWSYQPWAQILTGVMCFVWVMWFIGAIATTYHAEAVDVPQELAKLRADVAELKTRLR